tara:strand:- start:1943 stop:2971 length:1029 start_codon:yes stop_codon:yes gene_type:complete
MFIKNNNTIIGLWLLILTAMVYLIILIGGLTRLTDSGLSMVDWRPLMGIIPPIGLEEWQNVFNQYKETPEYLIINQTMQLNEFKYIFWWEYFHRLFARLIGFVFVIPFIYFLFKKHLSKALIIKLLIVLLFGFLQAFVGWWMVKSGLNDDPYVSQYRLSFHLTNAIIILSILLWMTLNQLIKRNNIENSFFKKIIFISIILCLITIISGSFVSGTDAGKSYNTFPLMNGKFIPDDYLLEDNFIKNTFENTIAIQFNHRWIAIFSFFWIITSVSYIYYNKINYVQKIACFTVFILVTIQVIIGILTLIHNVPISLASIHQMNAILLYCSLLITYYLFSKKESI